MQCLPEANKTGRSVTQPRDTTRSRKPLVFYVHISARFFRNVVYVGISLLLYDTLLRKVAQRIQSINSSMRDTEFEYDYNA